MLNRSLFSAPTLVWGWLLAVGLPATIASSALGGDALTLLAVDAVEAPEGYAVVTAAHSDPVSESKLSDAERIARLQRTLDSDKKHLTELKAERDDSEKEYQQADTDFKQLDSQLEAARHDLDQIPPELEKKWELAKQRFELAIREHKALQASISTLETKMARDQELVDKMLKPTAADPASGGAGQSADLTSDESTTSAVPQAPPADAGSSAAGLVASGMVGSMVPLPGAMPTLTTDRNLGSLPPMLPSEARSKELSAAAKETKKKNVAAHQAQVAAESATERRRSSIATSLWSERFWRRPSRRWPTSKRPSPALKTISMRNCWPALTRPNSPACSAVWPTPATVCGKPRPKSVSTPASSTSYIRNWRSCTPSRSRPWKRPNGGISRRSTPNSDWRPYKTRWPG
jgi:hypothetical protein